MKTNYPEIVSRCRDSEMASMSYYSQTKQMMVLLLAHPQTCKYNHRHYHFISFGHRL